MAKLVCKTLTLAQRVNGLDRLTKKKSQTLIASLYKVDQSQISIIIKNKNKIMSKWQNNINPDKMRKRSGIYKDFEEALKKCFSQAGTHQPRQSALF
ncbi:hypothetical protein HZS_3568 [Henneguya salminicola]|nr:hypothetical protein HZS_3568 [Henneguya salminicola]